MKIYEIRQVHEELFLCLKYTVLEFLVFIAKVL